MVRIPVSPILVSLSLSRSLTLSIHALLLSVSGNPSVVQTHHQIPIVASRLLRHGCIEILMIVRVSSTQALPHWHSSRTGQSASTVHANITPIRLLVARLDNTLHVYCTVQYSTGPTIRALQYVCLLIATSDRSSVHSRRFWTVASTFRTPADACQDPEIIRYSWARWAAIGWLKGRVWGSKEGCLVTMWLEGQIRDFPSIGKRLHGE
jgi:hypothetical protein